MIRIHTFRRGNFTLWADRVPAMHGMTNSFTLWHRDGAKDKRLIGGVSMPAIRERLQEVQS